MPVLQRLIEDMSVADLKGLIIRKKAMDRAVPLKRKLGKLQKAIEKIERKIAKLTGGKPASRRGRPPKARRGRPPTKGKRGRPAKRGRKPGRPAKRTRVISKAGRARIAAAQRKRWAAVKKAKAAKAKKAVKRVAKVAKKAVRKPSMPVQKVKAVAPKAGTLAAKIEQVAGAEAGQS